MNDSLDLRKRILKMRESNKSIQDMVKPQEIREEVKFLQIKEKEFKYKEIPEDVKPVEITEEPIKDNYKIQENGPDYFDTNEAQFRIIANKFNEAVEVILELSDKVKKLEKEIYNNDKRINRNRRFYYQINLKIIMFVILIPIFIIGVFTLPFDLSIIKLIFIDIISTI
jgi:hypothetical protein